jgi:hypothetical protein
MMRVGDLTRSMMCAATNRARMFVSGYMTGWQIADDLYRQLG